jgi:hypothetical protein
MTKRYFKMNMPGRLIERIGEPGEYLYITDEDENAAMPFTWCELKPQADDGPNIIEAIRPT